MSLINFPLHQTSFCNSPSVEDHAPLLLINEAFCGMKIQKFCYYYSIYLQFDEPYFCLAISPIIPNPHNNLLI